MWEISSGRSRQNKKKNGWFFNCRFISCFVIPLSPFLNNIMYLLFLLWLTQEALKMIDVELLMKNYFKFSLSMMGSPYGGYYRYLNVYLDSNVLGFHFLFVFICVCSCTFLLVLIICFIGITLIFVFHWYGKAADSESGPICVKSAISF